MRARPENLPEFPDNLRSIEAARGTRVILKLHLKYVWEGLEPGQIWDPIEFPRKHLVYPVRIVDVDKMILVEFIEWPPLRPRWEYPSIFVNDYEPRHPRIKARFDLWKLYHDKNISGSIIHGYGPSAGQPINLREKVEKTRRRLRLSKRRR